MFINFYTNINQCTYCTYSQRPTYQATLCATLNKNLPEIGEIAFHRFVAGYLVFKE